jgi:diketogulonate reductase-like aldo/keto reductase
LLLIPCTLTLTPLFLIVQKLHLFNTCRTRTRSAVSASLDRLVLDYLDLYLIHWLMAGLCSRPQAGR